MQKKMSAIQNRVPEEERLLVNKYITFACFKIRHIL